jgi:Fe-S-cluster containining protein
MINEKKALEKVAKVYQWLDEQIDNDASSNAECEACGRCCDFMDFDHRLYVSNPELVYFHDKVEEMKSMTTGRCPYNIKGKCSIHKHRFAGCRIFLCKGDADFQSQLSEAVIRKFKEICLEFKLPYRYIDLNKALNGGSANICQSAGELPAEGRSI